MFVTRLPTSHNLSDVHLRSPQHYNAAAELDPTDMVFLLNISAVYFEQKENDRPPTSRRSANLYSKSWCRWHAGLTRRNDGG